MEKNSTEKLKSNWFLSKRMKWIIIAVVVAVLMALAFSVVFITLKPRRDMSTDISSTVSRDSDAKEVDVVSLVGFHGGRMIARGNTTEGLQKAIIDYQLQCKEHTERVTGSMRLHSDWLYHGDARQCHRRGLHNGGRYVQL